MKLSLIGSLLLLTAINQAGAREMPATATSLAFIENKGQITDQFLKPRADIQFALQGSNIAVFIGNGQLHYQFSRTLPQAATAAKTVLEGVKGPGASEMPERKLSTYRMDVELVGANVNASAIAEDMLPYYENYYLPSCPDGAHARTCGKITYKSIYPSIDWVIYIKDNKLEHEFVVGPGGNAADIRMQYHGQTDLAINTDGSITAATPMGTITEHAPVCYNPAGQVITSAFRLRGNVLNYKLHTTDNIIIDPTLEWATYYGPDSTQTYFYRNTCDAETNVYAAGLTYALNGIATSGTYQNVYGTNCDAFLVKFDSAGHRLWGTYYGGTGGDWGIGVACDPSGNVYLGGVTQGSTTGIASAGAVQTVYGGGLEDGFLAKFDSSGARKWATYIGGTGAEIPGSVACDVLGHVYIAGFTTGSTTNIATAGSFMPSNAGGYEDFLVQYDTLGVRQWGTYYGGSGAEYGGMVASDGGHAYLTGYTSSTNDMASAGCYQPALSGSSDAFVAKFDVTGTRNWGSYYGGTNTETAGDITISSGGIIYLLGATSSDAGIATPGCFQPTRGGEVDAFLFELEPELGYRTWGTYYGGPGAENVDMSRMGTDAAGSVYITGFTPSTSGIANSRAWQSTYGGGTNDCFVAKFLYSGAMVWSTYYGGTGDDGGYSVCFDGHNAYVCGETSSPNNIVTPGAFLTTPGTGDFYYLGFLAKLNEADLIALETKPLVSGTNGFTLYPNPVTGTFTLSGSSSAKDGTAAITITDAAGRTVQRENAVISNGIINKQIKLGATLAPGSYILQVQADKLTTIQFQKQ